MNTYKSTSSSLIGRFWLAIFFMASLSASAQSHKTRNIILVTMDGFRWQEVFHGADSSLMNQQPVLKDQQLKQKFWRDDQSERREALLPFFWTTIANKGQLYGDRDNGSFVNVTNHMWFSYPGYNELLTGAADDEHINSNDKIQNPNETVFEFINHQPSFKGHVAAYSSWDCFPYILNAERSGITVNAGLVKANTPSLTDREKMLNELLFSVPDPLGDVRLDAFTFYYGLEYMKENKPRVMYFAFDETDDFAHAGEYTAYLNSAHYIDGFIGELWDFVQHDPAYRDKTTLVVTCDHGRGDDEENWKHHGSETMHSDQIWFVILGPDTPANFEIKGQFYQNQLAQTMSELLGLQFNPSRMPGKAVKEVSAAP